MNITIIIFLICLYVVIGAVYAGTFALLTNVCTVKRAVSIILIWPLYAVVDFCFLCIMCFGELCVHIFDER